MGESLRRIFQRNVFRDEFLNINIFYSVLEAKVFAKYWRNEYNEERPHSLLGMLDRANFAMRGKENQIRQLVGNTR
jgi:transposase InsO family protein